MKSILITGATSFLGLNLINSLHENDNKIFAVIRRNSAKKILLPKRKNIHIIELEMCEYSSIHQIIDEPCDTFYVLAWQGTRGDDRNNVLLQQQSYQYSLDSVIAVNKLNCKSIILAGSQAEYGPKTVEITEELESQPISEYGKYKYRFFIETNRICKEQDIYLKEARIFSLYGPFDHQDSLIMSLIKDLLLNKTIPLTQCIQYWDYLHVIDAVKALQSLDNNKIENGIYNIASGESKPLKSFIECIYHIIQSKSHLQYGLKPYPPDGIVDLRPSIKKIKDQTGWVPNIIFREGIISLLEDIKK